MKRISPILKGATLTLALGMVPVGSALAQVQVTENPMGVSSLDPGETGVTRVVKLGTNKSIVIDLDRPASDVIITNPQIADATVQTARRIIFRGVQVGQTNAFVFGPDGRPLINLEITVDQDTAVINDMIQRYVPDARVSVESANSNLVVSGTVDSLVQSDQVMRLVTTYSPTGDATGVVNMMSVRAKDQVMLEVRIVEMQRTVVKQLGINLTGMTSFGDLASQGLAQLFDAAGRPLFFDPDLGLNNNQQGVALQSLQPTTPFSNRFEISSSNTFNIAGGSLGGLSSEVGYTNFVGGTAQSSLGAKFDALERVGIVRTLAEPNIMAVSGESAKFLAGGEFPVPVSQDEEGRIGIEFKPFGVGLAFTPVVLSEGRISLKVSTEISELSNQGAFQGQSIAGVTADGNVVTAQTLTIPSLTVRRAESVVELPSGGSTMLAGLIQSRTRQTIDQLPGIKKLPVLGSLFQSRDFINEETEMVVIITPYLVDPAKKDELKTPADGFVNASDPQTIFFGKLNAQYADAGEGLSKENYSAPVGFIEE
ncbi:MAG: type II and III secretion system protein family protein [Hyphomonas sp.]|jgi:pilus assembly protein CpaC|nr:type II and III secretion system protein family protein [Hyphomonas sp.]